MKKLLIIIAVLISSYSYGQWNFTAKIAEVTTTNKPSIKYDVNVSFMYYSGKVYLYNSLGNISNSFSLKERHYYNISNAKYTGWMCIDGDGTPCLLAYIDYDDGTKQILLIYSQFSIKYK